MDRRSFFNKLGTIAVGSYAYLNLPIDWIPTRYRHRPASLYLSQIYNMATKSISKVPYAIAVSQELFDVFEGELEPLQRFTTVESDPNAPRKLLFKMAKVYVNPGIKGWDYGVIWKEGTKVV